jgi:hypothetical protein
MRSPRSRASWRWCSLLSWIETHQSLARHRKTLQVVAALHVDRHKLLGHLLELWWWGLDNADKTGFVGPVKPPALAAAAGWPIRDAERFVGALVGAKFVDHDDDGGYWLHDWYDYAGKLAEGRAKNRARMAAAREQRTTGARATHVQRTFDARAPATVPDHTGPNRTGPTPPINSPPAGQTRTNGAQTPERPKPRQCPECGRVIPASFPPDKPFCHEPGATT